MRRRVVGLALGAAFGAASVLAFAPAPLAHAEDCVDGAGNTVPCPTDAPTSTPPTQAPPTLPPPTQPPPTSPPPATVSPQTVAPGTTPTTRRPTRSTQDVTPATPAPTTVATTPPSTKPKQKATTTTRATTTTSAPDRIVTAPIGNVGPPGNDGGSSPAKTIAAILGVALLLVLGILGPELRSRFGRHRPSAI